MPPDLDRRINAMFARDTAAATAFVVVLWIVMGFVFFEISRLAGPTASIVLLVAGGLVVLFNTASITAMLRHYSEEKDRIYGLDIEHLDAIAAVKRGAPAGVLVDEVNDVTGER
jgi:hypothetical protein